MELLIIGILAAAGVAVITKEAVLTPRPVPVKKKG